MSTQPEWRPLGTRGFEFRVRRGHGKFGPHYDVELRTKSAPDVVRCLAEQELRAIVAELDEEQARHGDHARSWPEAERRELTRADEAGDR